MSTMTGEDDSKIVVRLLQSLGLVLHWENARAIVRRLPMSTTQADVSLLTAAAGC